MNSNRIKIAAVLIALVLSFAFGRYSIRSSLEKEFARESQRIELEYTDSLKQLEAYHARELSDLKTKITEMEKVTVIDKDGKTTITEKTKTKEKSKTKEKVVDRETTKEQVKVVVETKEVVKEVTKTIAPPTWRVYGTALLSEPSQPKRSSYGAGFMYDVGPFNVGAYGLHNPDEKKGALGFTAGIAF